MPTARLARPLPDKPPKPKLQRERDTTLRDLQFDDLSQDHEMLAMLSDHEKTLTLAHEAAVAAGATDAATLIAKSIEQTRAMAAREREDLARHHKRGAIAEFVGRERSWRP